MVLGALVYRPAKQPVLYTLLLRHNPVLAWRDYGGGGDSWAVASSQQPTCKGPHGCRHAMVQSPLSFFSLPLLIPIHSRGTDTLSQSHDSGKSHWFDPVTLHAGGVRSCTSSLSPLYGSLQQRWCCGALAVRWPVWCCASHSSQMLPTHSWHRAMGTHQVLC